MSSDTEPATGANGNLPRTPLTPLERGPYVGAEPFGAADKMFFHGRDREGRQLAATVAAGTLTVVYGKSGVGKTSLLNARLPDELDELDPGWAKRVIMFSTWQPGFFARLCTAVTGTIGRPVSEKGLAIDLIAACREADTPIALVLDQFEEYFLYHPGGDVAFETELAGLANLRNCPVRVVLSLRSDSLFLLDRLRWRIPDIFRRLMEILPLDARGAAAAIIMPLREYQKLAVEAGRGRVIAPRLNSPLVEALTKGATEATLRARPSRARIGGVAEAPGGQGIVAPFLQLALKKLWQAEAPWKVLSGQHARLRLETLRRLGAKAGRGAGKDTNLVGDIMERHVEGVLNRFTPDQQEVCAVILDRMITPDRSKVAAAASTIRQHVQVGQQPLVSDLLEALASGHDSRLLRKIAGRDAGAEPSFEIVHDELAVPLLEWMFSQRDLKAERLRKKRTKQYGFVALGVLVFGYGVLHQQTEARRTNEIAQLARQASDRVDHGDTRTAIVLALEALEHQDKLAEDDKWRMRALLGRSLDGLIDLGVAYTAPAPVSQLQTTSDGNGLVVVSEAEVGDEAASTDIRLQRRDPGEEDNRKKLVQWISVAGAPSVSKRFEAPASSPVFVSPDGDAVYWAERQDPDTRLMVARRDMDKPVSVQTLPGERIVSWERGGRGNDLVAKVTTIVSRRPAALQSHFQPDSPVATQYTFRHYTVTSDQVVRYEDLPPLPGNSKDWQVVPIGHGRLAAFSKDRINVYESPTFKWREVFALDPCETRDIDLPGGASRTGGNLIIKLNQKDAFPGQFVFLRLPLNSADEAARAEEIARIDARENSAGSFGLDDDCIFIVSPSGVLRVFDLRLNNWTSDARLGQLTRVGLGADRNRIYLGEGSRTIRHWSVPRAPVITESALLTKALSTAEDEQFDPELDPVFDPMSDNLIAVKRGKLDAATTLVIKNSTNRVQVVRTLCELDEPQSFAIGANLTKVVVGTKAGEVSVCDHASGESQRLYKFPETGRDKSTRSSWVDLVALSANGRTVAAVNDDGDAVILSDPTGKEVHLEKPRKANAVALSGNGDRLLLADSNGDTRIYDTRDGKPIRTSQSIEADADVKLAALDATGHHVVTATKRGDIDAWDVETGLRIGHWKVEPGVVSVWINNGSIGALLSTGKRVTWVIHDLLRVEAEARALHICPLSSDERARLRLPDWSAPVREDWADTGIRCQVVAEDRQ